MTYLDLVYAKLLTHYCQAAQYHDHKEKLAVHETKDNMFWQNLDRFLATTELELVREVPEKRARDETRTQ